MNSVEPFIRRKASNHFFRIKHSSCLDYDDLVNVGRMGAFVATSYFDPAKGYKYLTYASWWIEAYMRREIVQHSRLIRAPSHIRKKIQASASDEELAASFDGINLKQRYMAGGGVVGMDSLDDVPVENSIPDDVETADIEQKVRALLNNLAPRDRAILEGRFFKDYTLAEVGKKLKITRERVRQLQKLAVAKLRRIAKKTGLSEDG